MSPNAQQYLMTVDWVLRNADASTRSWRTVGRRVKLAGGVPHRFVAQPVVGPQVITVAFQCRAEDLSTVIALDEQFAMVAGASGARVYRDLSLVRVEFSLPFTQWRDVRLSEIPHRGDAATIGRTALGGLARVGWDTPHKALFGSTQTGKTTCLIDLVYSLAMANRPEVLRLLVLNPKNDPKLAPFARLAHLEAPIATGYDDSAALLRYALAEMNRRRDDVALQERRLVVVIDEVAQLVEVKPETGAVITQLSQMAGGLRENVIVASQAANPKVFGDKGSLAMANLPSRLVFQLPADQSYMATRLAGQHTERLMGKGDALAVVGDQVVRFRAALPAESDFARLPLSAEAPAWPESDRLAGDGAIQERWQVDPEQLAYALVVADSATQLQRHFGGKMDRARLVRDYARELRPALEALVRQRRAAAAGQA